MCTTSQRKAAARRARQDKRYASSKVRNAYGDVAVGMAKGAPKRSGGKK